MALEKLEKGLKINERGEVGEARTYELLAEDFWILSRSVDTDGTDFLIERGGTGSRINSTDYPRLGRIQSKYRSNESKSITLKYSYVYEKDIPSQDFFLILHYDSRDENDKIIARNLYCLTGQDIHKLLDDRKGSYNKSENLIKLTLSDVEDFVINDDKDKSKREILVEKINIQLNSYDFNTQLSYEKYMLLSPKNFPIIDKYEGYQEQYDQIKNFTYETLKNILYLSFNLRLLITSQDPSEFYTFIQDEADNTSPLLLQNSIKTVPTEIDKIVEHINKLDTNIKSGFNDFNA